MCLPVKLKEGWPMCLPVPLKEVWPMYLSAKEEWSVPVSSLKDGIVFVFIGPTEGGVSSVTARSFKGGVASVLVCPVKEV